MPHRKLLSAILTCVLTSVGVSAEEQVATVSWSELKSKGELRVGEVVATENDDSGRVSEELLIVNDSGKPINAMLLTLEPTGLTKHLYTLRGRIRYEGVTEAGHLEMWNEFKDGNRYFTKTLAHLGPMAKITGDSKSREFIIPFQSSAETGPPVKIELNLVLPANGKVWISPMKLCEFSATEWSAAMKLQGAWWDNRMAGWIGGIFGPLFGILGAIVGVLAGRGRGRDFCLGVCWFVFVIGIACLIAGLVALQQSQPYQVYFPLLLLGTIGTVVMGSLIPQTRKRFADLELHRMEAMDAGVV